MRIFLAGISCVGKTTIGAELAALLQCSFFDLDAEIESYFSTPIEHLQDKHLSKLSFRKEASKALKHILDQQASLISVIALRPSGLMDSYWRLVKKSKGIVVVLTDDAENILNRIVFFDKDSKPIQKNLYNIRNRETFYHTRRVSNSSEFSPILSYYQFPYP